ncbi:rhodanese-like domain-containing protein [Mucilaginibacter sp. BT774]|uniref:rhodanese-like domain-containing protein n=1 Tax=Mucilaginibacter sp. BT774 TaxID=3062276 RepID=UPI002675803D|nr:rhodanese-like domain-containing protein [Mucilaginibacter sp. BT774]MDO3625413.1 rhodanese-like domain-containing protein [Mucilaginibacter sp. BT774]
MTDIDAKEVFVRLQNGEHLNLLDVRGEMEYHTFNIGGKNIPLPGLQENIDDLEWNKDDEIIVICKVGLRSATAKSILELKGYKNIRNLTGGLVAWQKNQSK